MEQTKPTLALVGFPGSGKTNLKTQLESTPAAAHFALEQLPGVVMLGCNTAEEEHVYNFLLGRTGEWKGSPPDGIVVVVNAEELSRQLYLAFQVIDLRLPVALCITGLTPVVDVNIPKMSELLGVPVFNSQLQFEDLQQTLSGWRAEAGASNKQPGHWRPSMALADAYNLLDEGWIHKHLPLHTGARLVEGLRLLTVPKAAEEYDTHPAYKSLVRVLEEARDLLESRNEKWTTAEVIHRNKWITQVLGATVKKAPVDSKPADKKWKWPKLW